MINYIRNFSFFLILIMPFSLIAGPAIPDISITLIGIIFLFILLFENKFHNIFEHKWVLISLIFWLFILFISN